MSPKEKAFQLIESYRPLVFHVKQARDCALVGIEETIKVSSAKPTREYMEQVKTELEKY